MNYICLNKPILTKFMQYKDYIAPALELQLFSIERGYELSTTIDGWEDYDDDLGGSAN